MMRQLFRATWRTEVDVTQCQLPANGALWSAGSALSMGGKALFSVPVGSVRFFHSGYVKTYVDTSE